MGNLHERYSFRYLLIACSFMSNINTTILGSHIAKKKIGRFWLRDMNFISKISVLRNQKLAF